MKLYHVTSKQKYDKYIKVSGLKPIEDIELKTYPSEGDITLYFFETIDDAKEYADENDVILQVDVKDLLRQCVHISETESAVIENTYDVLAVPNLGFDGKPTIGYRECIIPPDKIKVVEG